MCTNTKQNLPDLFKVTIVKDKEILVLLIQTLNVVRNTLREVPDVSRVELLGGEASILIHSSEEERSVVDETPFGLWKYMCYYRSGSMVSTRYGRLTTLCQCSSRIAPFFKCC